MSFQKSLSSPRFRDLPVDRRRQYLCREFVDEDVVKSLLGRRDLEGAEYSEIDRSVDAMIENAIGAYPMPLGVVTEFCVDGEIRPVAMATEEPSVIAGLNRVSRIFRSSGGARSIVSPPVTAAQIAVGVSPCCAQELLEELKMRCFEWEEIVNHADPELVAAGGGFLALDFEIPTTPPQSADRHETEMALLEQNGLFEPLKREEEAFIVATLQVATCDAMGANAVNTMAEALLREWNARYGHARGYAPCMAIVSNRAEGRKVGVQISIPETTIEEYTGRDFSEFALRIERAMRFANVSPARAATHNKGILNGIIAAAIPLGQDTRAICVSALDGATRSGVHRPLSQWFCVKHRKTGIRSLLGRMDIDLPVGFVGGMRRIPHIDAAFQFDRIQSLEALAGVLASVGLAQNFAALWALVTDGIQAGHLKLHERKKFLYSNIK